MLVRHSMWRLASENAPTTILSVLYLWSRKTGDPNFCCKKTQLADFPCAQGPQHYPQCHQLLSKCSKFPFLKDVSICNLTAYIQQRTLSSTVQLKTRNFMGFKQPLCRQIADELSFYIIDTLQCLFHFNHHGLRLCCSRIEWCTICTCLTHEKQGGQLPDNPQKYASFSLVLLIVCRMPCSQRVHARNPY